MTTTKSTQLSLTEARPREDGPLARRHDAIETLRAPLVAALEWWSATSPNDVTPPAWVVAARAALERFEILDAGPDRAA
jgi:hypothetical protein